MASNDYHFITRWRLQGTIDEVYDVLGDAPGLARWWPSVYLSVDVAEPGDDRGVGKVVRLHTKGWLPYTLRWQFVVIDARRPEGFSLTATGDFVGAGVWTFTQDGAWADILYDWRIRADKPLLRLFSFILKPVFGANHRWAMRQGEKSLRLELERRNAMSEEERSRIPEPPGAKSR